MGGYSTTCLAEDMELVLKMHRHFRQIGKPYRITCLADPVCWTEVPEDLRTLRNQRMRWQRGLLQCMALYRDILFRHGVNWLGWVALPFLFFFEGLGPILEFIGLLSIVLGFVMGWISFDNFALIMAVAIGLGTVLSLTSILLEEAAFHTYPRMRDVLILIGGSVVENIGYRQLLAWWRLRGLWQWLRRKELAWGAMVRTGSWQSPPGPARPVQEDAAVLDSTGVALGRSA